MIETLLSPEEKRQHYICEPGNPHPIGATIDRDGVNFSLYAKDATAVELLLFAQAGDLQPIQTIQLNAQKNRSFSFWHVYIRGLRPSQQIIFYAFRVDGPNDLHGKGQRYSSEKVLIDPYGRANCHLLWKRENASGPGDNLATSMRSVLIDPSPYNWEGDQPLNHPWNKTIIYELHVRGFTMADGAQCIHPGTFLGITEKIPYLKRLGVTAIELLPIFDFDEKQVMGLNPANGQPLTNYWGYDPISYFAPQASYCTSPEAGTHLDEFRDMVKALHRADIEVILDVVFNHTGEGNESGPTINLKGIANSTYYLLTSPDRQYYWNFSGAGNTINANHPVTAKMIIDALEYWVREMHVDGFRFDEAVILTRGEDGAPAAHPPVVWQIELSDTLAKTKVIAEAWDAGGLYEVGSFPGQRWGEWNGRYRDAVRRFVKGDSGWLDGQTITSRLATVISGSADIFQSGEELPTNSVNFITAHDGFTMNDLVSYNAKHNESNAQNNTDGINDNLSWNCGFEGPTSDQAIETLRTRQIKNFCSILLLSQGVPMFVAGDEVRRTQQGNNNAYCQDNEISWFDWSLTEKHFDLLRFYQKMIEFRKQHITLRRMRFFNGKKNSRGLPDVSWHGCRLNSPGWSDPSCHVLSFTLGGQKDEHGSEDTDLHIIINMYWQDLDFELPAIIDRRWQQVIDTSQPSPADIAENLLGPLNNVVIEGAGIYHAPGRSIAVFLSHPI